jgi:hypothetical protein
MEKRCWVTLTMTVMLTLFFITLSLLSTPASGSDELKRALLEEIISVDKPELFGDYGELYLAKTKTQAVIQGMDGGEVTPITKEWVDLLLALIDDFERMAALSKTSVPSNHKEAINISENVNSSIQRLSQYETARANGLAMLAELALQRFYRGEGEFFEELARNEEKTRVKIEYEQISARSYKNGGIYTVSDASRMEFESRRDEWLYNRDIERASGYIQAARSHLDTAKSPSQDVFGAAFIEILKAKDLFENAKRIYEKHGANELEKIKGIESEIKTVYQRLMLDTLKVVAIYLLILSVFTFIIWKDFERWDEELNDTRLGEELIG